MKALYLGQLSLQAALSAQAELRRSPGTVLGFEPNRPVITLGVRGQATDDVMNSAHAEILVVDRGGQATLHNPGQLVIFPVLDVRNYGAREWVCALSRATQRMAKEFAQDLSWDEKAPGLYDSSGAKVVAIGVRLSAGISTHGLAINVRNNLREFEWIRPCGRAGAPMAHLNSDWPLMDLFHLWVKSLAEELTFVCAGS